MKLKKIIPIIIAVLAVCAVAVIIVLNAKDSASDAPSGLVQNQGNTSEPASDSTSEPTADPTVSTEPVDIQLAEFKEMLSTAREMLASGEVITVNSYDCLSYYSERCRLHYPKAVSFAETTISIDSSLVDLSKIHEDGRPDVLYFFLLTMILDKYSDCTIPRYDFGRDTGMGPHGNLYLCTEYKEAGYETAKAFHNALVTMEYTEPTTVFVFDLCSANIRLYSDREYTNYYKILIAE